MKKSNVTYYAYPNYPDYKNLKLYDCDFEVGIAWPISASSDQEAREKAADLCELKGWPNYGLGSYDKCNDIRKVLK